MTKTDLRTKCPVCDTIRTDTTSLCKKCSSYYYFIGGETYIGQKSLFNNRQCYLRYNIRDSRLYIGHGIHEVGAFNEPIINSKMTFEQAKIYFIDFSKIEKLLLLK